MNIKEVVELLRTFVSNRPIATVLFFAIMLDVLFGVLRASKEKRINSTTGNGGLIQKTSIILCVMFLMFVDYILKVDVMIWLPTGIIDFLKSIGIKYIGIATFFSIFFILFELLSIVNHLELMGVPMPKFIKKMLENTIETIDKQAEENK